MGVVARVNNAQSKNSDIQGSWKEGIDVDSRHAHNRAFSQGRPKSRGAIHKDHWCATG
jgi:hypothetical protein